VATFAERFRKAAFAVGVSLALFTWSQDALAKKKPPQNQDVSAVAQYRESIPTSSGPSLTGSPTPRTQPLPPAVQTTITRRGGRRAGLLVKAATSSGYGAPQERLPRVPHAGRPEGAGVAPAVATAPWSLLGSAGGGRLLALLVVLPAVTVVLGVAARRRPAGKWHAEHRPLMDTETRG
jgi:hypothetical protein